MLTGHLPELVIVLTLAFVIFGPKRIPEIGASLGQGIRGFKRGIADLDGATLEQTPEVEPVSLGSGGRDPRPE
jgi:sec-independent protein translocase protein TatA